MKWRRIRNGLLTVGAVAAVLALIVAWSIGGALIAPANRLVGPPPDSFPAATIQIPSESGTTLAAWYLDVPGSVATVILFHSVRGDRRTMLSRAQVLREHGYSTLLVDLQAHGESPGENITLGYREGHEVRAAVDFIRGRDPKRKISIIGCSLGGASTVFAHPDVDAIVLESVYPTVSEAVHNRIAMRLGPLHRILAPLLLAQLKPRLGLSPDQLCPIREIERIHCPILIAAGDQDKHTSLDETRRIFDAANEPKRIVIFGGAEHVDLPGYDPKKYKSEIVGWLDSLLTRRVGNVE